jgi:phosphate transport system substrate-binding protein
VYLNKTGGMKMKKISRLLSVAVVLGCIWSTAGLAEEIRIGGGGAPMDNIIKPVKGPFEKSTGIKLNLAMGSATHVFKSLAKGELDASTAGISFDGLMDALKKEGSEVKDPAAYQSLSIGKGVINIIIHKDNPVTKLSKEQIKGIFTGKIANWKDVGGKDSPIIVVLSTINPATNGSFKTLAMDGEAYVKETLDSAAFEDTRNNVSANPEAIGFGPYSIIDATVKAPEIPEFARDIILITKGKPTPAVQKFIDFVKGEGQKYVIK